MESGCRGTADLRRTASLHSRLKVPHRGGGFRGPGCAQELSGPSEETPFRWMRYAVGVRDHAASSDRKGVPMEHSTAAVALQPFLARASAQFDHMAQELGHWVLAS